MVEKSFAPKEIIYREGDTPDVAYIVLAGKIELLKSSGRDDVIAGSADVGTAFGEEALLSDVSARIYSAKATQPTKVEVLTPYEFDQHLAQTPKPIQGVLFALARHATSKPGAPAPTAKKQEQDTPSVSVGDIKEIIVSPANDSMKKLVQEERFSSGRLPLRIGGHPQDGSESSHQNHFSIPSDGPPLKVSRQHCELIAEDGQVKLIDLGSRFCTMVNGKMIGRGYGIYTATLKKGPNEVILGGKQSPYKITIQLV